MVCSQKTIQAIIQMALVWWESAAACRVGDCSLFNYILLNWSVYTTLIEARSQTLIIGWLAYQTSSFFKLISSLWFVSLGKTTTIILLTNHSRRAFYKCVSIPLVNHIMNFFAACCQPCRAWSQKSKRWILFEMLIWWLDSYIYSCIVSV